MGRLVIQGQIAGGIPGKERIWEVEAVGFDLFLLIAPSRLLRPGKRGHPLSYLIHLY